MCAAVKNQHHFTSILNPTLLFRPRIKQTLSNGSTAPYKNFTQPPLVVADMMAGVGPFAVPLSMPVNFSTTLADKEIKVHANGKNCCLIVAVLFACLFSHCVYRTFVYILCGVTRFGGSLFVCLDSCFTQQTFIIFFTFLLIITLVVFHQI